MVLACHADRVVCCLRWRSLREKGGRCDRSFLIGKRYRAALLVSFCAGGLICMVTDFHDRSERVSVFFILRSRKRAWKMCIRDRSNIEATPTYELKPIEGGRYLCYATEYDMKLEFNTVEEKDSFDALIGKYAKKWDSNTDGDGNPTEPLLAGAWWPVSYTHLKGSFCSGRRFGCSAFFQNTCTCVQTNRSSVGFVSVCRNVERIF